VGNSFKEEKMDLAYTLGFITFAMVISTLAQALKRSGLLWFFLGLFFGPVALFFLMIIGRNEETE
jgi:hypothetical protein